MDIRIGVTQIAREISLEQADEERDATKAKIEAALSGTTDVLWLVDKRVEPWEWLRPKLLMLSSVRLMATDVWVLVAERLV